MTDNEKVKEALYTWQEDNGYTDTTKHILIMSQAFVDGYAARDNEARVEKREGLG